MPQALTDEQLRAVSNVERACSILSLAGCVFTIVTFSLSKSFRKPINRLVFYATFGNMMTNVGTLISRQYLPFPNSPGCQFQAFLIQMFMPADAFWTLAMATNVYLTFYHKYDARDLRKMEIPYLLLCYGIPFIPAFVYIFVKNSKGQRPYGNATLWCWVSTDWDIWRLLTFYVPVWVVIVITFSIYIRAGRTIYEKRKELGRFASTDNDPQSFSGEAIGTIKTTEVTITSEPAPTAGPFAIGDKEELPSIGTRYGPSPSYAVHIAAGAQNSSEATLPLPSSPRQQQISRTTITTTQHHQMKSLRRRHQELSNAAWAYTKSAILFFTAILITWIPSCANRVYPVAHNGNISVPLEFMSAFVLPLQGFWNAVIYAAISWTAVKEGWSDIRHSRRAPAIELESDSGNRAEDGNHRQDYWMSRPVHQDPSMETTNESGNITDTERGHGPAGERHPSL
ncbi:Cyclic AMP receptor-like protein A [Escovopsis weberi]|uniref:Cyclic AMP receptor-like protein A n=1 Tax=Escovopsis weberi TaxID=150374 RepID=A0A0N0RSY7_ESCWE|nr:Cyclic AMP receptor-like protein A [Escovopsis weberi]